MGDAGQYYTPELSLPSQQSEDQSSQGTGEDALKQCSVRGCQEMLLASRITKMCDTCRGRHRVYATTKRLRRKMEKAALQHIVGLYASESGTQNGGANGESQDSISSWPASPDQIDSRIASTGWDSSNMDPVFYQSQMPCSPPGPPLPPSSYPTLHVNASSSSELANALVFSVPSSIAPPEPVPTIAEAELIAQAHCTEVFVTSADPPNFANDVTARFCSVKGCKVVIPGSYEYKMCPSCRVRYRGYGTTKRRKWKTEREAFDHEMSKLRFSDKKVQGNSRLLSTDNPKELRHWEGSVLDEQIPLPDKVLTALEAAGIRTDGTLNVPSALDPEAEDLLEHFSKVAEKVSTVGESSAVASIPTPSARMCTVSHCHKILPGYYRYKRCEQHRLQNRHHSKLKRVREKVVKALGPDEGAEVMVIDPVLEWGGEGDRKGGGIEEKDDDLRPLNAFSSRIGKARQRPLSCVTEGCQNLLPLEQRWKRCDICRLYERRRKARERRAASHDAPADPGDNDIDSTPSSPATINTQTESVDVISPSMPEEMSSIFAVVRQPTQEPRGDNEGSAPVPCQSQPDTEADLGSSSNTSDRTLGMVSITPRAYEAFQHLSNWSTVVNNQVSEGVSRDTDPHSAHLRSISTSAKGTGNSWESTRFITTTAAHITAATNGNSSTLTFRGFKPETALSRFLTQHPYVTVEPFTTFSDTLCQNSGSATIRDSDQTSPVSARIVPEGSQSPVSATSTSPAGGSSTDGNGTTSAVQTPPNPCSTGGSRLDIPRAATSTSESFRYYTGPPGLQRKETEARAANGGGKASEPQASSATGLDKPPEKQGQASAPMQKPADALQPLTAVSVPTNASTNAQASTSLSPYPAYLYAHGRPQTYAPTYPYYVPAYTPGYPYAYPLTTGHPPPTLLQVCHGEHAQEPAAPWPVVSGTLLPGYPAPYPASMVQPSFGFPHAQLAVRSVGFPPNLPYPYNTYMPVTGPMHPGMVLEPLSDPSGATDRLPASARQRPASEQPPERPVNETRFRYYQHGVGLGNLASQGFVLESDLIHPRKKRKADGLPSAKHTSQVGSEGLRYPVALVDGSSSPKAVFIPTDLDERRNKTVEESRTSTMTRISTETSSLNKNAKDNGLRTCHGRNCHRAIPANISGTLCARCKTKIKKHQEKNKTKFKLIPFKSLVDQRSSGPSAAKASSRILP